MADVYKRGIYLYINGQEIENNVKKITGEMRKLVNEQARMTIGSKEYVEAGKKILALRGVLAEHQQQLKKTESGWFSMKKAAEGFNRYFGMMASFVAGMTGMVLGFRKAVDASNLFEERIDNLSALTGLTGKELEWLGDNAKESSIKITESGIRIKQSATDIVDAYTKMGSQRPELLKNKEALAAVTEDAIILSEAAKSDLAPAVAALATTMNQFNAQASESTRIINILAAGSKEGAAEIPYLTEALEKSGTTANMMGLSIEQTVGMIEAVAPKFAEARIAGTGFDRVLLTMRKNNIGYKDGVFDMNRALDQLRVLYASGTSSVDLFGMEHAKMAEVMLQAQGDFNRYTNAVTGSNVAIEQASINTNNNAAMLAQARNKMALLTMELGEKLAPAMTFSTNSFSYFIKALMAAPEWIQKNKVLLIALGGALLAYNGNLIKSMALQIAQLAIRIKDAVLLKALVTQEAIQIAMTAAEAAATGKFTLAKKIATIAQLAFNKAMLANPIGWVIAGITALVAGLTYFATHTKRALAIEREKKAVVEEATQANQSLGETYKTLANQVNQLSNLSIQEKKDLQDKIDKTIELTETEINQLKARRDKLFAEASMLNWWQKLTRGKEKEDELANKKGEKAVRDMDDALQKLFDTMDSFKQQKNDLAQILNAESIGDAMKEETVSDIEAKMQRYQTALRNVAVNGEDYHRIQKKMAELQAKLAKAQDVDISTVKLEKNNDALDRGSKLMAIYSKQYSDLIDDMKKTQDDLDKSLAEILEKQVEEIGNEKKFEPSVADKQGMADYEYWLKSSYDGQLQLLDNMLAEGEMGEIEHAARVKEINGALQDDKLDQIQKYSKAASDLINVVTMFQEAAKNRELKAAGDNVKKKEEIEKKWAIKQQRMVIVQTIIDGIAEVAGLWKGYASMGPAGTILAGILTGIAVARTAANIALISSQQFAHGKYPVKGADDGRTYQSAYVGPVRTGLYNRPTLGLFSEREPEIVIDGPTTRNIQANYPGILKAINLARVNQFAAGNYPGEIATSGGVSDSGDAINIELIRTLAALQRQLLKPIRAKVLFSDIEEADDDITSIRNKTTIS